MAAYANQPASTGGPERRTCRLLPAAAWHPPSVADAPLITSPQAPGIPTAKPGRGHR